jgi:uncharacterized protein YkwD
MVIALSLAVTGSGAVRLHATAAAIAVPTAAEAPANELLERMNTERAAADAPRLAELADLHAVAVTRATEMASVQYFAHVNADGIGAEWLLRARQIPFELLGENIARSNYPPEEVARIVHRALMASAEHRANILDARFNHVGIAVVLTGDMYYFVVIFTD